MRLVANFEDRDKARRYFTFITNEGIKALFEKNSDNGFQVWIYEEGEIDKAKQLLADFEKDPNQTKFDVIDDVQIAEPKEDTDISEDPVFTARMQEMRKKMGAKPLYSHIKASLTKMTIFLCVILFLVSMYQRVTIMKGMGEGAKKVAIFTPIEKALLYGIPSTYNVVVDDDMGENDLDGARVEAAQEQNVWLGLYYIALNWPESKADLGVPMFVEISKGQLWRIVTPALLHGGFLHIIFNMMWLWLLGKQVEERMGRWRYIFLMIVIAAISNTVEYLMVGPAFLGFSGVVCGLAGFIWMRQRVAPWEGYPLQKGAAIFLAIFVLGIAALQVVSFTLKILGVATFPIQIANAAHLSGAIVGIVLAKMSLFARKKHER